MPNSKNALVVAHDYFTQTGGAERVAIEIASAVSADRVVSPIVDLDRTFPELSQFRIQSSSLNKILLFRRDPRFAFPLLRSAWREFGAIDAETVICSSSGWSHYVDVTPTTRKLVYCHNPARWLYQPDDFFQGLPSFSRKAAASAIASLKGPDARAARTADAYLANSTSVAMRVKDSYGITAEVLHPPVSVDVDGERSQVAGTPEDYFLLVSRARSYKGSHVAIEAFERLGPGFHLVIAGGATDESLPSNVTSLGRVTDAELRWLYANARALIGVSREDFGLTPIEANAFGTPVIVLRAGGYVDTTVEGESGLFLESLDVESLVSQVRAFPLEWDPALPRRNAKRFSRTAFSDRLDEILADLR